MTVEPMRIIRAFKMVLTLHCDESSHLLSDATDRRLTGVERLAVTLHLMICRNCRRFRQRLRFLTEALHRLASGTALAAPSASLSLAPEARRRIAAAIRQQ